MDEQSFIEIVSSDIYFNKSQKQNCNKKTLTGVKEVRIQISVVQQKWKFEWKFRKQKYK